MFGALAGSEGVNLSASSGGRRGASAGSYSYSQSFDLSLPSQGEPVPTGLYQAGWEQLLAPLPKEWQEAGGPLQISCLPVGEQGAGDGSGDTQASPILIRG